MSLDFKIAFKDSVKRDFKKIDKSKIGYILDTIEKTLGKDADKYPVLSGKYDKLRKFRIGEYRVIYSIVNDTVIILRIGHRKDVYK